MNEKEVAEIRRRFQRDKNGISTVCGCYVSETKEVVSTFSHALGLMTGEEAEQVLALLKKSLGGAPGRNLMDISIDTEQVVSGPEHKLLMALRNSALKDEEAVRSFYECAIPQIDIEGNYMILLAHDTYDVPYRTGGGHSIEEVADEVYSYIVCAVCPLKLTKPALGYQFSEGCLKSIAANSVISPPELGFLFPAFDDRCANIYGALYYTRNLAENHGEFVEAVFRSQVPMPAAAQKDTFRAILGDAVAEDCSLEVAQAVHGHLAEMIVEYKENEETEPLRFGKGTVKRVLENCGVSAQHVAAFEDRYNMEFGPETELNPVTVVDLKQIEVSMPGVSIRINPERSDLLQTRILDGARYILIRAEEGVEVNGVSIYIAKNEAEGAEKRH